MKITGQACGNRIPGRELLLLRLLFDSRHRTFMCVKGGGGGG